MITESNPYERVPDDDPRRCQGVTSQGQCHIIRMDNSEYCIQHAGAFAKKREQTEKVRNYRLTKWRAQVEDKADSSVIKDISEEIGILRMLMQERLESITSNTDLLIQSNNITELAMKIGTLVNQLQTMETKLGTMLHANQAIQFAAEILEAVARHIDNSDAQEAIANEIEQALTRATTR